MGCSVFQVSIYFDNVLLRGNRSVKVNAAAFDAFKSPNLEPLATMGIHIRGTKITTILIKWPLANAEGVSI